MSLMVEDDEIPLSKCRSTAAAGTRITGRGKSERGPVARDEVEGNMLKIRLSIDKLSWNERGSGAHDDH